MRRTAPLAEVAAFLLSCSAWSAKKASTLRAASTDASSGRLAYVSAKTATYECPIIFPVTPRGTPEPRRTDALP